MAGPNPLMNDLSEVLEHRVGWQIVIRKVFHDVGLDSARGDKHNFYVLVEKAAFQAKSIVHQMERTLRRRVQPVPWGRAVYNII